MRYPPQRVASQLSVYNPIAGPINLNNTQKNANAPAPYNDAWFIQYIHPFSPVHTVHARSIAGVSSHAAGSCSHAANDPFAPARTRFRFAAVSRYPNAGFPLAFVGLFDDVAVDDAVDDVGWFRLDFNRASSASMDSSFLSFADARTMAMDRGIGARARVVVVVRTIGTDFAHRVGVVVSMTNARWFVTDKGEQGLEGQKRALREWMDDDTI